MFIVFKDLYIYLREREKERARACEHGDGGRQRERESPADSSLSTEPDLGLHTRAWRLKPKQKPAQQTEPPLTPPDFGRF